MAINPYADNFIPIIPIDGELEHSPLYPFCVDPTCDCHEDDDEIAAVEKALANGLITPDEATDFVLGKLL